MRNLAHTIPKCFESNTSGIEYKKYYYDFHISHPHNYINDFPLQFCYNFPEKLLLDIYLKLLLYIYLPLQFCCNFPEKLLLNNYFLPVKPQISLVLRIFQLHAPLRYLISPPLYPGSNVDVNHTNLRFKILAECGVSFYEQQPCHKNKIRRIARTSILRFQFCILNCFFPSSSVLFSERLSNAL